MLNKFQGLLPEFKVTRISGLLYSATKVHPKSNKTLVIPFFYTRGDTPERVVASLRKTWEDLCSE